VCTSLSDMLRQLLQKISRVVVSGTLGFFSTGWEMVEAPANCSNCGRQESYSLEIEYYKFVKDRSSTKTVCF
jgi:hypothetical protein